jgi:hypothetical protein
MTEQRPTPCLFILIDAMGWEILRNRPFLDDVLPHRCSVETILGYSSGAIPSLLTGQTPAQHGHWNLFYRSPETSPFRWTKPLLFLPEVIREHRVTRRLVKEISRRRSGYTGYFAVYNLPIDRLCYFDICETSDIYLPGGLAPAWSLFDYLQHAAIPYECFNYHQYSDEEALRLVPQRLKVTESRVFFVYLSGFDSFLHFNVHEKALVDAKLASYEAGVRCIYDAARARWGEFEFRVFSDHGMTPIAETRDLIGDVRRLGLQVPRDFLPAYDSTMARFWCESPTAAAELAGLLAGLPYGRLIPEGEMDALGLAFPDDRYGQFLFVMNPGTLICPSDMGRIRFQGMHGFHPHEDPHSAAAFLSNGRAGDRVRHITDLLPALLGDLSLPAAVPARRPKER